MSDHVRAKHTARPRPCMPGVSGSLALALIVVYTALSVAAVSCPVDAQPRAGQTHHHQHDHPGGPLHSPLCAWACQANLSASLAPSSAGLPILLLLIGFLPLTSWLPPAADLRLGRSRSPPLPRLSR